MQDYLLDYLMLHKITKIKKKLLNKDQKIILSLLTFYKYKLNPLIFNIIKEVLNNYQEETLNKKIGFSVMKNEIIMIMPK